MVKRHHIGLGVIHPLRPVLQVNVDAEAFADGVADGALDVGEMGFDGFAQLHRAVVLRSLDQQVQDAAAVVHNPIHRGGAVDEAEDLDFFGNAVVFGPVHDFADRQGLAVRDSRGTDFDGIDARPEQGLGDDQLFIGRIADARRLLPIPECGIHYFDVLHSALPHAPARAPFIMQQPLAAIEQN